MNPLVSEIIAFIIAGPGHVILRGIGFRKKDMGEHGEAAIIAGLFGWAIVALFVVIIWSIFFRPST